MTSGKPMLHPALGDLWLLTRAIGQEAPKVRAGEPGSRRASASEMRINATDRRMSAWVVLAGEAVQAPENVLRLLGEAARLRAASILLARSGPIISKTDARRSSPPSRTPPQQVLVAERLDTAAERRLVEAGDEPPHGDVLAVGGHRDGHGGPRCRFGSRLTTRRRARVELAGQLRRGSQP